VSGAGELPPIEPHIRQEDPPADGVLVIRGGPLTIEKLLDHAVRQQRDYSFRGQPMASVSVAATVDGWTVDRILRERLWSRTTYGTATVATVQAAGYELLPTHRAPHYDIVLPAATFESASMLLTLFGTGLSNPFRRRTR
jgi:hypothetical protein